LPLIKFPKALSGSAR